ncbi:AAA family ATPase [Streptococcus merionis]|uniref:AAA family ATPase n=1 Tax=Streptococcus merionis TaxID=400065 RepID=UPI0026ECDB33|nr:AAA family ATPase [Streptococcus merionis]
MNIMIIGAQASGKMTVGQELAKLTGATLIHNHETIDFVLRFIPDFTEDMVELNSRINFDICDVFAQYGRDWIGTAVIDFQDENQVGFLTIIQNIFHRHGRKILFVELDVDLEERLCRNRSENRLKHKPLKRHIEVSEREILETANRCQYISSQVPDGLELYLKIDNTELSAHETAQQIVTHIGKLEVKED